MNIRSITFVIAALVMFTVAVCAQDWTLLGSLNWDWTQNLYVHVDAGYLYQQDTTFNYSASNGSSTTSSSGNISLDPGVRGDIIAGYNLNRSWAVEFNTGLLWSSSDNSTLGVSLNTYTVPILVNVLYNIPLKGPWSSFVGIGGGGAATTLSYTYNPTSYTMSDYDFVFGYQAKAGLRYRFSQNASIDIAYEFLGTTDPRWQSTQTFSGPIPPPTTYQFQEKGFYTHSLVISFTWTF
jgi:opacity protein-like surface antigen